MSRQKNNSKASLKEAIILLAHGSPNNEITKVLFNLKKKLSILMSKNNKLFFHAYLQFNKPNFGNLLKQIVAKKKVSKIIVLPVFISHGKHILLDVPKIINLVRSQYKHVEIRIAKPLESDDYIVKLLCKRYYEIQRN